MKIFFFSITVLLSIAFTTSHAQNNRQVLMNNGFVYPEFQSIEVKSDSLLIKQSGLQDTIPIESIFELRQSGTNNFWTDAAIGGISGCLLGFVIGVISTHVELNDSILAGMEIFPEIFDGIEYGTGCTIGSISAHENDVKMPTKKSCSIPSIQADNTEIIILAAFGANIPNGMFGALAGDFTTALDYNNNHHDTSRDDIVQLKSNDSQH